jgi:D-glycero-alpha-D-manno-heptose-7-phosphate kinase
MIIEASAPTRVDLAGGTIDIPPIFLFHEGAATVNFAVNLMAHCRLETRNDDKIFIESIDRGEKFETSLGNISSLRDEPRLELLSKLVYFFKPETGFNMITNAEAPAGAGLAGSSTLNIACVGALNRLVGNRYTPDKFIQIANSIETTVIRVIAGFQDYYSAQYGSVASIHFRPDGIEREALDVDTKTLEDRIVVLYTGEPRNSGINNWDIRDDSIKLRSALLAGDWNEVGEILRAAHPHRKRLSAHITTPRMNELIDIALANGAIAPKICGAGGGGCIAFYCQEGRKSEVENALRKEQDAEVLNWKICKEGLVIRES